MAEAPPSTQSSWSDVPLDLADLVLRLLPAHVDRVRFTAVCAQWRTGARWLPLQPPLPLLLLIDGTMYSFPRSERFHLPDSEGYVNACACGKLLFFSGFNDSCFLKNPLSKETIVLPALSRVRIKESEMMRPKIIPCDKHVVATNLQMFSQIPLCRPGCSPGSMKMYRSYDSLAFHKGNLYGVSCSYTANLHAIRITEDRINNSWVPSSEVIIKGDRHLFSTSGDGRDHFPAQQLYLVGSQDTLLLVCRTLVCGCAASQTGFAVERTEFEVFEADFAQSRWVRVTTVGVDTALFIGPRCSRAVCVSQHEIPGDHIYFLEKDGEDRFYYGNEGSSSVSAYIMRDGTFSSPLPMITWSNGFATCLFP